MKVLGVSFIAGLGVLALGLGGLVAGPASAAYTPGKVRLVQIVGNSTSSLTLDWTSVRGAKKYQVEMGTNFDMDGRTRVKTTRKSKFTVTGLKSGATYCFQVRAMANGNAGSRSHRTCKPTIIRLADASGPRYKVMTYNLCTKSCDSWSQRRGPAMDRVRAVMPDVLALQETADESGVDNALDSTYRLAYYMSAKMLFFNKARFTLKRANYLDIGNNHYAVWADLADDLNGGKRVIFVSTHFTPGPGTADYDRIRAAETERLLGGIDKVNTAGYPVVFAGDFNSHRSRKLDSPADVFHAAGYWDSFDLAAKLRRPNFNSANGGLREPKIGVSWGAHVDHVWVKPASTRVLRWANAAEMANGKYAAPLPSDHNPIVANIQVN